MGSISIPVWTVIPVAYFGFWGFLQNLDWLREGWDKAWRYVFGDVREEIRAGNQEWVKEMERRSADRARHPSTREEPPPSGGNGSSRYLGLPPERTWDDIMGDVSP